MKDVLYRRLLRHVVLRLFFLYFAPLFLLTLFFHMQYGLVLSETRDRHMKVLAEQQAAMLDLFLEERLLNLVGVAEDMKAGGRGEGIAASSSLERLQQRNAAFVDLAVLDEQGRVLFYDGPHEWLVSRNYAGQEWFVALGDSGRKHVVSDIYPGFRGLPHFTMAISVVVGSQQLIIKAALSPGKIREHIGTFEGSSEVQVVIVNGAGDVQISTSDRGGPAPPAPAASPRAGVFEGDMGGETRRCAWSWLRTTNWALVGIETDATLHGVGTLADIAGRIWALSALFVLLGAVVSWVLARWVAREQWKVHCRERELTDQLIQSSKLATVGELAAGVAHEINNPLAVISEKAGLVKDSLDPAFGRSMTTERIGEHLTAIEAAVSRCAVITRKLLDFVRPVGAGAASCDPRRVIDDVADTLIGPELADADIRIVRNCPGDLPPAAVAESELAQVLLNLVKNAADAIEGAGTVTVTAGRDEAGIVITVDDTGCGLTPEEMRRVFTPFYTTKDPGRGTGLGLSVSYSIVEGAGGEMTVESSPGRGSRFKVRLPAVGSGSQEGGTR